jgi:hypothetical protein
LKPISPIQAARTANETAQMATRLITFTVQVYSVGAQPRKNSFSIPRIVVVIRPFPARAEAGKPRLYSSSGGLYTAVTLGSLLIKCRCLHPGARPDPGFAC